MYSLAVNSVFPRHSTQCNRRMDLSTDPRLANASTQFIAVVQSISKKLGVIPQIGLTLVEGHYSQYPWVTPQQAAVRAGVSDDTARRHLKALVAVGRATCRDIGSDRRQYRIDPKVAESVIVQLSLLAHPQI